LGLCKTLLKGRVFLYLFLTDHGVIETDDNAFSSYLSKVRNAKE